MYWMIFRYTQKKRVWVRNLFADLASKRVTGFGEKKERERRREDAVFFEGEKRERGSNYQTKVISLKLRRHRIPRCL